MESILIIVAMFALLYFMMIRPENKRRKQAQEMRDNLKKGDTVTTIGGIVGKIVQTQPDTIIIETSEDRVRIELTRWAVSKVGDIQTTQEPEPVKKVKKEVEKKDSEPEAISEPEEKN